MVFRRFAVIVFAKFRGFGAKILQIEKRDFGDTLLMEEMRFFPAAERALTASDWSEIEAAVTNPDDPLFGCHVEKKYCDLQLLILQIDREAA